MLGNERFRPLGGIAKENKAHNFDVRSNSQPPTGRFLYKAGAHDLGALRFAR